MKILAIGDVVGICGVELLREKLWKTRDALGVDFTAVNAENASDIHGVSAATAKEVLDAGADLITLGNHTYGKKDICTLLSDDDRVIRPANFPPLCPGGGYTVLRVGGYRLLCINVMGTALMEPLRCPFETVDRVLESEKGNYDISLLDVHAETTSEKIALARYFDGRINIIYGTHTHVQTADEQILPGGTGYITDLGMTGPVNGVIGADSASVIERFRTHMPTRFTVADGEARACGALFVIDTDKMRVSEVRRVVF